MDTRQLKIIWTRFKLKIDEIIYKWVIFNKLNLSLANKGQAKNLRPKHGPMVTRVNK